MDFEEIYKTYFKDVYLFILSMSQNSEVAEEITQETFFKALKGIDKFRGDCSVKSWLCQIGKNTYLTHLKKQKKFSPESPGQGEDSEDRDAESLYIEKEDTLSIYKVLHYLEDPYKEVFTLRVLGDLTFQEIGEIFERKEGWARVTFHRAKQKVRELLKERRE